MVGWNRRMKLLRTMTQEPLVRFRQTWTLWRAESLLCSGRPVPAPETGMGRRQTAAKKLSAVPTHGWGPSHHHNSVNFQPFWANLGALESPVCALQEYGSFVWRKQAWEARERRQFVARNLESGQVLGKTEYRLTNMSV